MSIGISMEEKFEEGGEKCKVRSRRGQRETALFSGFPPEKRSSQDLHKNTFSPQLGSSLLPRHVISALLGLSSYRETWSCTGLTSCGPPSAQVTILAPWGLPP